MRKNLLFFLILFFVCFGVSDVFSQGCQAPELENDKMGDGHEVENKGIDDVMYNEEGCDDSGGFFDDYGPVLGRSEYFDTNGIGIRFEYNEGDPQISLMVWLIPRIKLWDDVMLEVEFENPADSSSPFILDVNPFFDEVFGGEEMLVESPVIKGLEKDKEYMVLINIYSDHTKNELLGVHYQILKYRESQEELIATEVKAYLESRKQ